MVEIPIHVNNNLVPPATVSVYLSRAGSERLLGEVMASRADTVRYVGLSLGGEVRLVVRTIDNRILRSPIVILNERAQSIDWSLFTNSIDVKWRELSPEN